MFFGPTLRHLAYFSRGDQLRVWDVITRKELIRLQAPSQRKELQALQKEFSPKIATILTEAQKTQIADTEAPIPL